MESFGVVPICRICLGNILDGQRLLTQKLIVGSEQLTLIVLLEKLFGYSITDQKTELCNECVSSAISAYIFKQKCFDAFCRVIKREKLQIGIINNSQFPVDEYAVKTEIIDSEVDLLTEPYTPILCSQIGNQEIKEEIDSASRSGDEQNMISFNTTGTTDVSNTKICSPFSKTFKNKITQTAGGVLWLQKTTNHRTNVEIDVFIEDINSEIYKKLSCRFCRKVFTTANCLIEHVNIHRKYVCEMCGERSWTLKSYFAHMKNVHSDGIDETHNLKDVELQQPYINDTTLPSENTHLVFTVNEIEDEAVVKMEAEVIIEDYKLDTVMDEVKDNDESLSHSSRVKQLRTRMTTKQLDLLVLRVCKDYQKYFGRFSDETKHKLKKKLWESLSDECNSLDISSNRKDFKTVQQWQKAFTDFKLRLKRKIRSKQLRTNQVDDNEENSEGLWLTESEELCAETFKLFQSDLECGERLEDAYLEPITALNTTMEAYNFECSTAHQASLSDEIKVKLGPNIIVNEHVVAIDVEIDEFLSEIKSKQYRKLTCRICGKQYSNTPRLSRHVDVHRTYKKYGCEICGKRCQTIDIFRRHNLNEHVASVPPRAQPIQPDEPIMEKVRSTAPNIVVPKIITERDAEINTFLSDIKTKRYRKLICRICNKMLYNTYQLSCHIDIHRSFKKYQCNTCGQLCQTLSFHRNHIKLHTEQLPEISSKPAAIEPNAFAVDERRSTESSVNIIVPNAINVLDAQIDAFMFDIKCKKHRNLICRFCPKKISSISHLTRHIDVHRTYKKYECKICGMRCQTICIFRKHKSQAHSIQKN